MHCFGEEAGILCPVFPKLSPPLQYLPIPTGLQLPAWITPRLEM